MRPRTWMALLTSCLACGLPLWPIPYSKVSLTINPSLTSWLVGGTIAALFAAYLHPGMWRRPILTTGAGFVLAVLGRVVVEGIRDPSTHNLWPFEVIIAGGTGLIAGVMGTLAMQIYRRLSASTSPTG